MEIIEEYSYNIITDKSINICKLITNANVICVLLYFNSEEHLYYLSALKIF